MALNNIIVVQQASNLWLVADLDDGVNANGQPFWKAKKQPGKPDGEFMGGLGKQAENGIWSNGEAVDKLVNAHIANYGVKFNAGAEKKTQSQIDAEAKSDKAEKAETKREEEISADKKKKAEADKEPVKGTKPQKGKTKKPTTEPAPGAKPQDAKPPPTPPHILAVDKQAHADTLAELEAAKVLEEKKAAERAAFEKLEKDKVSAPEADVNPNPVAEAATREAATAKAETFKEQQAAQEALDANPQGFWKKLWGNKGKIGLGAAAGLGTYNWLKDDEPTATPSAEGFNPESGSPIDITQLSAMLGLDSGTERGDALSKYLEQVKGNAPTKPEGGKQTGTEVMEAIAQGMLNSGSDANISETIMMIGIAMMLAKGQKVRDNKSEDKDYQQKLRDYNNKVSGAELDQKLSNVDAKERSNATNVDLAQAFAPDKLKQHLGTEAGDSGMAWQGAFPNVIANMSPNDHLLVDKTIQDMGIQGDTQMYQDVYPAVVKQLLPQFEGKGGTAGQSILNNFSPQQQTPPQQQQSPPLRQGAIPPPPQAGPNFGQRSQDWHKRIQEAYPPFWK